MPETPPNQTTLGIGAWVGDWLEDSAALAEVLCGRKVFPLFVPANVALPAVTYERYQGTQRTYSMKGQSQPTTAMILLKVVAPANKQGYKKIEDAGLVIASMVSGLTAAAPDGKGGKHYISSVEITDEYDMAIASQLGDQTEFFVRLVFLKVKFTEQIRNLMGGA